MTLHERKRGLLVFWATRTLSQLGSSFTKIALPLVVFGQTGSGLDLGLSTAAGVLPYPLLGLVLGAWSDRRDRKQLMIAAEVGRALLIATIPALVVLDRLPIWWLYVIGFACATLTILYEAAEAGVVPALAGGSDLNTLNGRLQASYAAAGVAGPVVAGVVLAVVPVPALFLLDAATFAISAVGLRWVHTGARGPRAPRPGSSLAADAWAGLRHVWRSDVLRDLALMMAVINLLVAAINTQLVVLLKRGLAIADRDVSWMYAAAGAGMAGFALLAGPLRRRLPFGAIALAAPAGYGALVVALATVESYAAALVLWGGCGGMAMLFNIVSYSQRQAIVPAHLLGRVMTIASVLAWSAVPIGALASGVFVDATGAVSALFAAAGAAMIAVAIGFAFTSIGRPSHSTTTTRTTCHDGFDS